MNTKEMALGRGGLFRNESNRSKEILLNAVEDEKRGPVTGTASVPNFDGIGVLGMSLSQQIAAVAALSSLRSKSEPL